MNEKMRNSLRCLLRTRREALWREVASEEERLASMGEERESELEEGAQTESAIRILDRLDERGKREIETIDAALRRIEEGVYGTCVRCNRTISLERLRALPEALECAACASAAGDERRSERESGRAEFATDEASFHERADQLTDLEMTTLLLDRLSADDRIDMDDLDVECRAGILHLSGSLPNALQYEVLRQEVMDIFGSCDVDDRVEIGGIPWEEEQPPSSPEIVEEDEPAESKQGTRKR
jgi:DnaK suppressor protein